MCVCHACTQDWAALWTATESPGLFVPGEPVNRPAHCIDGQLPAAWQEPVSARQALRHKLRPLITRERPEVPTAKQTKHKHRSLLGDCGATAGTGQWSCEPGLKWSEQTQLLDDDDELQQPAHALADTQAYLTFVSQEVASPMFDVRMTVYVL